MKKQEKSSPFTRPTYNSFDRVKLELQCFTSVKQVGKLASPSAIKFDDNNLLYIYKIMSAGILLRSGNNIPF